MAPSDEAELNRALKLALNLENLSAIRYPRDNVPVCNFEDVIDDSLRETANQDWKPGVSRTLKAGSDATLLVYGALMESAFAAVETLAAEGIEVGIVDARFCKPLDGQMLGRVLQLRASGADGGRSFAAKRLRQRGAGIRGRAQFTDRANHAPWHARPSHRSRDSRRAACRSRSRSDWNCAERARRGTSRREKRRHRTSFVKSLKFLSKSGISAAILFAQCATVSFISRRE